MIRLNQEVCLTRASRSVLCFIIRNIKMIISKFVYVLDVRAIMPLYQQWTLEQVNRKGQSMSYKVGSMLGQAVTSIGKSKSKLEEEQNCYACIINMFDEIVR